MVTGSTIYLYLLFIGVALGFLATWPNSLRLLRPAQMLLFPILLCCMWRAWTNFGPTLSEKALSGVLLFATSIGLIVALVPNLKWLLRSFTEQTAFRLDGRYIDEDDHLQPIRKLVEANRYVAACQQLEELLKTHRADFPSLLLLVQLYHQLKKDKLAERCIQFMMQSASTDDELLAASRLYHQLTTG
jgi:hypothetical protein